MQCDLHLANVPVENGFELNSNNSVYARVRRLPSKHHNIVREEVQKMLEAGIIVPSCNEYMVCPVTGIGLLHWCV